MQANFLTGKTKGFLERKKATQYGGWRHRLLDAIFKETKKEGKQIVMWAWEKNTPAIQVFKEVAERNGFTVKKDTKIVEDGRKPPRSRLIASEN